MGLHAFQSEPEHYAGYRAALGDGCPPLHGCAEGWNMPVVRHRLPLADGADFPGVKHFVLTVHLGGARVRRVDDARFGAVADRGAVSLQRPGSGGSFRSEDAAEADYAHFYFRQGLVCEVGEALGITADGRLEDFFAQGDTGLDADLAAYLSRASDAVDTAIGMEIDSRAYVIALRLLRAGADAAGIKAGAATPVDRAVEMMEDRIGDPLRLSDLAAAVDLSPFHFSRMFRREKGETPAAFLMRRRTERAAEMIRETDAPLADVAHRLGFSSQSHMTSRIKQQTGATPGKLRRG